jgi:thymidylate synthase
MAVMADSRRGAIDQIANVVAAIRRNPIAPPHRHGMGSGRCRQDGAAACHCLFQFYVAKGRLSCQLINGRRMSHRRTVQHRSYALLTLMVAQVNGLQPGEFVHTLGDAHLYLNHLEQARLQLARPPRRLPTMVLNPAATDLFAFVTMISRSKATTHTRIKAQVAV